MRSPRVFIGSSTEGTEPATAVRDGLEPKADAVLWTELFKARRPPIEVLELQTATVDFAVLVATPDDPVQIRGRQREAMRDNILFEFGLFSGAIGRSRTHLLLPNHPSFQIPSDFADVACYTEYESPQRLAGPIAEIRSSIDDLWRRRRTVQTKATESMRGLKLLRFVSWARDEFARASTEWDESSSLGQVAARLQGVSSFLMPDVENLGVSREFGALLDELARGTEVERRAPRGRGELPGSLQFLGLPGQRA